MYCKNLQESECVVIADFNNTTADFTNASLDNSRCEYPDSTHFENKISGRGKLPKKRNTDF